jgi:hypothetical protein
VRREQAGEEKIRAVRKRRRKAFLKVRRDGKEAVDKMKNSEEG